MLYQTEKKSPNGKYSISNNYFIFIYIIIQITDEILSEPTILHIYTHNENKLCKKTINLKIEKSIIAHVKIATEVGAWVVLNFWANLRLAVLIEVVLIKKKACT